MSRFSRRALVVGGSALALGGAAFARRSVALAGPTDPTRPFFDSMMRRFEFELVADSPDALQDWLSEEGRRAQRVLHRIMNEGGFENRLTGAYVRKEVSIYLLGHKNGKDVCSPIFIGSCFGSMFEGPTLVGLSLAAEDWTSPDGIPAVDGLLPRNTLQHDPSWFEESMTKPYHVLTAAGDLSIRYESKPEARTGTINVLSREVNGASIFEADYGISW
jgi:hypothetical protein